MREIGKQDRGKSRIFLPPTLKRMLLDMHLPSLQRASVGHRLIWKLRFLMYGRYYVAEQRKQTYFSDINGTLRYVFQ